MSNAEILKKQYERLLKRLDKEVKAAENLHTEAQALDLRKKTTESAEFSQLTANNANSLRSESKKLHSLLNRSNFEKLLPQKNIREYYIQLQAFIDDRKTYRKTTLLAHYRQIQEPEFFERQFAHHLFGPFMVISLLGTAMMGYISLIGITPGDWFVLALATAQASYYLLMRQDKIIKHLAKIGATLDDLRFRFSTKEFYIQQLYNTLTLIVALTISIGAAILVLNYVPTLPVIATWPIIYQYAVLTGIGIFSLSVCSQIGKDIYYITFHQETPNPHQSKTLLGKLLLGFVGSLFIALVSIAEAVEQLGMLAALIHIGTTAQLFIAFYGLWYFISSQMSSRYKLAQYGEHFDKLTWNNISTQRWAIIEFLLITSIIVGITFVLFHPPIIMIPLLTQSGLFTLPEVQRFITTFGIACISGMMLRSITSSIRYLIWHEDTIVTTPTQQLANLECPQEKLYTPPPFLMTEILNQQQANQSPELDPSEATPKLHEYEPSPPAVTLS